MQTSKKLLANVFKSEISLADGRSLFFYDLGEITRSAIDKRQVEPPAPTGELRHDALRDDWVAIAAHRQTRTFMPPKELCPLCPTAVDADEKYLTEIPADSYEVVVFDNRFPSLTRPSADFVLETPFNLQVGPIEAAGKCEVVCFSSNHNGSFKDLSTSQVRVVLEAWKDRTNELGELPDVQHVFVFENRGTEIGVTLPHPHGQIYGYSYIPMHMKNMIAAANDFYARTSKVLLDEIVAREIRDEVRVVVQNSEWVAFVPYASRYPYEIHIAPKRSVKRLPDLDENASSTFAEIYLEVLKRLDGVFDVQMPYIAAWYQASFTPDAEHVRLHLQITSIRRAPDKIKYLAGSEAAMGAFIGDVTPESSAAQLRDVKL
jgi:UDPglucose--hexose-1-phosphate uridylyltransferase